MLSSTGQIYFDQLYLREDKIELITTGGTVMLSDGYMNWIYGPIAGEIYGNAGLILTDFEGNVTSQVELPLIDTVQDQGRNIIALDDSTFITLSFEQVLTEDTAGDMILRKLDRNAVVEWKETYGLPNRLDIPQMVRLTSDGGFIIVGQVAVYSQSDEEADCWLVKTDADGVVEWEQTYGGSNYDNGADVVQTADGGYLFLGWTRSFGQGLRDFYLIKTDSDGNEEWFETYGGTGEDVGSNILRLLNGNFLLIGGGTNGAVTTARGLLYEVTPSGQEVWHQEYTSGPSEGDHLFKSLQLNDGSIVSCGLADNANTGGNAGWLIKTDANGELTWQRIYDKSPYTDLFYSVLATQDGGFLLSGQAWNDQTSSQDAWLLKVDSVGCPFPNCITGVDEEEKTIMVDVWPNPCVDVLNVEKVSSSKQLDVSVFDLNGKLMHSFTQNDTRDHIDITSWPAGIYALQGIDKGGRSFSLKFVKE